MRANRFAWPALVAGLALSVSATLAAAGGGSSKVKVQQPVRTTTSATTARGNSQAGRTTVSSTTTRGPRVKTQTTARGNSAKPTTTTARGNSQAVRPTAPGQAKKSTTTTTPIPPTGPTVPMNKAQQLLTKNSNLRAKLASRLPLGTDVIAAAEGFRNLGQFVAAVNVSNNLGLDFPALKALMTGEQPLSLGQAIQQLRGLDTTTSTTTAASALDVADAEIKAATPTIVPTTSTKKKGNKR